MVGRRRRYRGVWAALAAVLASPSIAASHTISTGVVVYDASALGSDDIVVDGADATLQIVSGGGAIGNAINLTDGGTLDNAGSIVRSGPGVSGDTGTVLNRAGGSIGSNDDIGIYFELGGSVSNEAGAGITGTTGILNDWPAGSGPGAVSNAGTITGTAGPGVDMENGGTVLNQQGGTITGADYGVYAWEGVEVTNTGADSMIEGGTQGVSLSDGGSLDNRDGATVTSDQVGVGVFWQPGTVTNSGGATITGVHNDAILFDSGGTVVNSGAGSVIRGGWNGIEIDGGGSVTNRDGGEIIGGQGSSAAAIYLPDGGTVSNGAGSRIVGDSSVGTYGIYASQAATVSNSGTIVGDVRLADQRENHVTLSSGSHIEGDLYVSTLDDDSTLTLDGADTQLFSAAVSGATTLQGGTLVKTGSGTWIMDTSEQGIAPDAVVIDAGTLDTRHYDSVSFGGFTIPQALSAAAVSVSDGATLLGDGRIGSLAVQGGATVAPGHSTGTLTVAGPYQAAAGSIYEAELSGDGTSDLISASGAATIASGAALSAKKYGPEPLTAGTRYTVLTASSVTGTYALLDDGALTAFLNAEASYDSRHAYLTVTQSRDLSAAAQTPNQRAAATGLQSAPAGSAGRAAVLNLANDAAADAAFDQLSGEIHASVRETLLAGAQGPREAALARLRARLTTGATLWSQGYGSIGHVASDGNGAAIDIRTGGFLFGADLPLAASGRIGVFGGTGFDSVAARGTATSIDATIGAYGAASQGPLVLRAGAAATAHEISTDRIVDVPGYAKDLRSTYGGTTAQLFAEVAVPLSIGTITLSPFAGVSQVGVHSGPFDEGNGGVHGAAEDSTQTTTLLGVDGTAAVGALRLTGRAGWQHVVGAVPAAKVGFADGSEFTVTAAAPPVDSAIVSVSLELALSDAVTLSGRYDGSLAANGGSHAVTAELRGTF